MTQTLAMTIAEFCLAHRISRPTFYNLAKRGEGPNVIRTGRHVIISIEEAAEWRKRMSLPVYSGIAGTSSCV